MSTIKTILVTGGAGLIGSHLIEELVKNPKNNVISLDNYFTGSKDNHIEGATYITGETKNISSLVSERPDIIYHLGEYSRVLTSFDDIETVWQLNVAGTFAVLEFCRQHNCKLIYAGSSTKFGEFENDVLACNQTPYAYFKASNTDLVNNYGTWYKLDYAITYFYNVYGGRELRDGKYATVIGIFTQKHLDNEPLSVVSPGTQKRCFTHVDDTVQGLLLVGEHGQGDGYAIGSPEEYSILDVARMFSDNIVMIPAKQGDRLSSKIDTSKIAQLGWNPQHHLPDYIRNLIT